MGADATGLQAVVKESLDRHLGDIEKSMDRDAVAVWWRESEVRGRMRSGCHGSSGASPVTRAAVRRPSGRRHGRPPGGSPVAPAAPARAFGRILPTHATSGVCRKSVDGALRVPRVIGRFARDPCGCWTPVRTPARASRRAARPWHPRRPPAPLGAFFRRTPRVVCVGSPWTEHSGCHGSSGASPDDPCGCWTPVRTPARASRRAARPWHPRRPPAPLGAFFRLTPRVVCVGSPWTEHSGCHGSSGASPADPCGCWTPVRTPARASRRAARPWHPQRPPAPLGAFFRLTPRVVCVGSPWTEHSGCHGSSGASPADPCGCWTPVRTPARASRRAARPWHPQRPPAPLGAFFRLTPRVVCVGSPWTERSGCHGSSGASPVTRAAVRRPSGRRHGRSPGGSPVAPAAPARASVRVLPTRATRVPSCLVWTSASVTRSKRSTTGERTSESRSSSTHPAETPKSSNAWWTPSVRSTTTWPS